MKKIIISLVFLSFTVIGFSQERVRNLTEKEKAEKRKNHQPGLVFSKKKPASSNDLKTSNATEEKENTKTVTTVKYYYGKEDTTFKEFKYKKP